MTLINGDGAVGDPASESYDLLGYEYQRTQTNSGIGVSVLLANWTRSNLADQSFSQAAYSELAYLMTVAPRTGDGAISHRASQVQLW